MILELLRLDGFRNLRDGALAFPRAGVAIVGPNAQGKSSLVEAIYYLEVFRSFRGARDDHLIAFGSGHFRIEGRLTEGEGDTSAAGRGGSVDVAAAFQRRGRVKKVTVDGEQPERMGDAVGHVGAVLFTPDDVRIVSDGPHGRRRFLDVLLSLAVPGYLQDLQRFRQVLAQRNAALREGGSTEAVRAWDPLLVPTGGRVAAARARWIRDRADLFASLYRDISGGEAAAVGYRPSIPPPEPEPEAEAPPDAWSVAFSDALDRDVDRERRMGTTRTGPHRDEVEIVLRPPAGETRDLREFGSGGQRRTAALALRLVEADTVRSLRGRAPLLLLDDVFAELDEGRSERVLQLLDDAATGQVVLTAPRESDVRFRGDRLVRWRIEGGIVDRGEAE